MQRLKNERGNILISFTELVESTYRLLIIAQDNTAKILGFVGRERKNKLVSVLYRILNML